MAGHAAAAWALAWLTALAGCSSAPPDTAPLDDAGDVEVADADHARNATAEAPPDATAGTVPALPTRWAGADATVRPGLPVFFFADEEGTRCTFGFLLATSDNATIYASTSAHCVAELLSSPVGAAAYDEERTVIGQVAFDGWQDEEHPGTDLLLIALNEVGRLHASPAVEENGGPVGLAVVDAQLPGFTISTFGSTTEQGRGRFVVAEAGVVYGRMGHQLEGGDSGGPLLSWDGRALGLNHAYATIAPGTLDQDLTMFTSFPDALASGTSRAAWIGDLQVVTAPFDAPPIPISP